MTSRIRARGVASNGLAHGFGPPEALRKTARCLHRVVRGPPSIDPAGTDPVTQGWMCPLVAKEPHGAYTEK